MKVKRQLNWILLINSFYTTKDASSLKSHINTIRPFLVSNCEWPSVILPERKCTEFDKLRLYYFSLFKNQANIVNNGPFIANGTKTRIVFDLFN